MVGVWQSVVKLCQIFHGTLLHSQPYCSCEKRLNDGDRRHMPGHKVQLYCSQGIISLVISTYQMYGVQ